MIILRRVLIGLGLSACLACNPARSPISHAPTTPADRPSAASIDLHSVPGGDISGELVGGEGRIPLDHAAIALEGRGVVAVSDSLGRFQLRNVNPGRHILRARRIGYYASIDTVAVLENSDTAIVITLRRDDRPPVEVCAGPGQAGVVLSVFPVGSPPGLPTVVPTVPRTASVVVSDRDFVERIAINSIPAQPDGVRRVYAANERPGTYQIEVSAPGFRPWRRPDVVVAKTKCDDVVPVQLDVHLEALAGPLE
jgi:hypothetical protein